MNQTTSPFLTQAKPVLKEILHQLQDRYPYVSILGTDVSGEDYAVHAGGMNLQPSPDAERGFVVRVQSANGFSEYSFNTLKVDQVVERVHQIVAQRDTLLQAQEALDYPAILEDAPAEINENRIQSGEAALTPGEILQTMAQIKEKTEKAHPEIVSIYLDTQWTRVHKIFLSPNRDLEEHYEYAITLCSATAKRGDNVKMAFKSSSGATNLSILEDLEHITENAATTAVTLLDATKLDAGEYDIITDPDFTGLIAHEAFGHGTEMDMFVKNRAKGAEYLDRRVASDVVQMHDGASAYDEVSSYVFDDEGTLAQDTQIIVDGIFRKGMADNISALYLGVKPTGNGKRESYKRKAYTRMTNTFFEGGETPLEELMAEMKHGYLLEGLHSGMEDPKNWGIQCVASHAREIKDGKFTGKIVSPVYLTGYVPDLLQSMSGASADLELSGSGYCGKGWKEWVKTSTGGAYMKAKGRLS